MSSSSKPGSTTASQAHTREPTFTDAGSATPVHGSPVPVASFVTLHDPTTGRVPHRSRMVTVPALSLPSTPTLTSPRSHVSVEQFAGNSVDSTPGLQHSSTIAPHRTPRVDALLQSETPGADKDRTAELSRATSSFMDYTFAQSRALQSSKGAGEAPLLTPRTPKIAPVSSKFTFSRRDLPPCTCRRMQSSQLPRIPLGSPRPAPLFAPRSELEPQAAPRLVLPQRSTVSSTCPWCSRFMDPGAPLGTQSQGTDGQSDDASCSYQSEVRPNRGTQFHGAPKWSDVGRASSSKTQLAGRDHEDILGAKDTRVGRKRHPTAFVKSPTTLSHDSIISDKSTQFTTSDYATSVVRPPRIYSQDSAISAQGTHYNTTGHAASPMTAPRIYSQDSAISSQGTHYRTIGNAASPMAASRIYSQDNAISAKSMQYNATGHATSPVPLLKNYSQDSFVSDKSTRFTTSEYSMRFVPPRIFSQDSTINGSRFTTTGYSTSLVTPPRIFSQDSSTSDKRTQFTTSEHATSFMTPPRICSQDSAISANGPQFTITGHAASPVPPPRMYSLDSTMSGKGTRFTPAQHATTPVPPLWNDSHDDAMSTHGTRRVERYCTISSMASPMDHYHDCVTGSPVSQFGEECKTSIVTPLSGHCNSDTTGNKVTQLGIEEKATASVPPTSDRYHEDISSGKVTQFGSEEHMTAFAEPRSDRGDANISSLKLPQFAKEEGASASAPSTSDRCHKDINSEMGTQCAEGECATAFVPQRSDRCQDDISSVKGAQFDEEEDATASVPPGSDRCQEDIRSVMGAQFAEEGHANASVLPKSDRCHEYINNVKSTEFAEEEHATASVPLTSDRRHEDISSVKSAHLASKEHATASVLRTNDFCHKDISSAKSAQFAKEENATATVPPANAPCHEDISSVKGMEFAEEVHANTFVPPASYRCQDGLSNVKSAEFVEEEHATASVPPTRYRCYDGISSVKGTQCASEEKHVTSVERGRTRATNEHADACVAPPKNDCDVDFTSPTETQFCKQRATCATPARKYDPVQVNNVDGARFSEENAAASVIVPESLAGATSAKNLPSGEKERSAGSTTTSKGHCHYEVTGVKKTPFSEDHAAFSMALPKDQSHGDTTCANSARVSKHECGTIPVSAPTVHSPNATTSAMDPRVGKEKCASPPMPTITVQSPNATTSAMDPRVGKDKCASPSMPTITVHSPNDTTSAMDPRVGKDKSASLSMPTITVHSPNGTTDPRGWRVDKEDCGTAAVKTPTDHFHDGTTSVKGPRFSKEECAAAYVLTQADPSHDDTTDTRSMRLYGDECGTASVTSPRDNSLNATTDPRGAQFGKDECGTASVLTLTDQCHDDSSKAEGARFGEEERITASVVPLRNHFHDDPSSAKNTQFGEDESSASVSTPADHSHGATTKGARFGEAECGTVSVPLPTDHSLDDPSSATGARFGESECATDSATAPDDHRRAHSASEENHARFGKEDCFVASVAPRRGGCNRATASMVQPEDHFQGGAQLKATARKDNAPEMTTALGTSPEGNGHGALHALRDDEADHELPLKDNGASDSPLDTRCGLRSLDEVASLEPRMHAIPKCDADSQRALLHAKEPAPDGSCKPDSGLQTSGGHGDHRPSPAAEEIARDEAQRTRGANDALGLFEHEGRIVARKNSSEEVLSHKIVEEEEEVHDPQSHCTGSGHAPKRDECIMVSCPIAEGRLSVVAEESGESDSDEEKVQKVHDTQWRASGVHTQHLAEQRVCGAEAKDNSPRTRAVAQQRGTAQRRPGDKARGLRAQEAPSLPVAQSALRSNYAVPLAHSGSDPLKRVSFTEEGRIAKNDHESVFSVSKKADHSDSPREDEHRPRSNSPMSFSPSASQSHRSIRRTQTFGGHERCGEDKRLQAGTQDTQDSKRSLRSTRAPKHLSADSRGFARACTLGVIMPPTSPLKLSESSLQNHIWASGGEWEYLDDTVEVEAVEEDEEAILKANVIAKAKRFEEKIVKAATPLRSTRRAATIQNVQVAAQMFEKEIKRAQETRCTAHLSERIAEENALLENEKKRVQKVKEVWAEPKEPKK